MLSLLCYNPWLLLLCCRFFVCSSPTMFRSSTLQINMDLNATNRGSILETPVTHPKTNTNPPYCITKPPKCALKKEENLIILQNISMWKKKKRERHRHWTIQSIVLALFNATLPSCGSWLHGRHMLFSFPFLFFSICASWLCLVSHRVHSRSVDLLLVQQIIPSLLICTLYSPV